VKESKRNKLHNSDKKLPSVLIAPIDRNWRWVWLNDGLEEMEVGFPRGSY
jgi:hypothetical protein